MALAIRGHMLSERHLAFSPSGYDPFACLPESLLAGYRAPAGARENLCGLVRTAKKRLMPKGMDEQGGFPWKKTKTGLISS